MVKSKLHILSTRKLSEQILEELKTRNLCVDVIPFIHSQKINSGFISSVINKYAEQKITAVFTSVHAVLAVTEQLKSLPDWQICCISGKTYQKVISFFGENSVVAKAPDAIQLSKEIVNKNVSDTVVFFCGNKRLNTLPHTLKQTNINLKELVVYETILTPETINKDYDIIIFFSPSAAESFFSVNKINEKTLLLSIGETTAKALNTYCRNKVLIAEEPTEKAIFALIDN